MSAPVSLIVLCPDCERPMRDVVPPGLHGVHWVVRDGRRVIVNCAGREVV